MMDAGWAGQKADARADSMVASMAAERVDA